MMPRVQRLQIVTMTADVHRQSCGQILRHSAATLPVATTLSKLSCPVSLNNHHIEEKLATDTEIKGGLEVSQCACLLICPRLVLASGHLHNMASVGALAQSTLVIHYCDQHVSYLGGGCPPD